MTLCIIIEPSSYTETYVGSVMKTVIVNRSGRSIRRSLSAVRKPCLEDHQLAHGSVDDYVMAVHNRNQLQLGSRSRHA